MFTASDARELTGDILQVIPDTREMTSPSVDSGIRDALSAIMQAANMGHYEIALLSHFWTYGFTNKTSEYKSAVKVLTKAGFTVQEQPPYDYAGTTFGGYAYVSWK